MKDKKESCFRNCGSKFSYLDLKSSCFPLIFLEKCEACGKPTGTVKVMTWNHYIAFRYDLREAGLI